MAVDESQGFREHASGCLNYSVELGSVLADIWALREWALPPVPGFSHPSQGNGAGQRGEPDCHGAHGGPRTLLPPRQGKGLVDGYLWPEHQSTQSQGSILV